MSNAKRILISRTDAIGDVMLTLPLCGYLKEQMPDCKIIFLCRTYTLPIVRSCKHIDEIINLDELLPLAPVRRAAYLHGKSIDVVLHIFPDQAIAKMAADAKIPLRVGTTNRWFHWLHCNKLLPLSRKNSSLHESQLNIKLAADWIKSFVPEQEEIRSYYGFQAGIPLPQEMKDLLKTDKKKLIIHPKSAGSAREWPLEKYRFLITKLINQGDWKIYVSGSPKEGEILKEWFKLLPPEVVNLCGKMSLGEFITFIGESDALLAASTGPLHIAAALDKKAVGLYSAQKPFFPQRWGPIGKKAQAVTNNQPCRKGNCTGTDCSCMRSIDANEVISILNND